MGPTSKLEVPSIYKWEHIHLKTTQTWIDSIFPLFEEMIKLILDIVPALTFAIYTEFKGNMYKCDAL